MRNLALSYHGDVMLNLLKMNEFKGTKGKWHHDSGTASIWHPNVIGHRLACVDYYGAEMSEEDLANAQLIAHAPEMLESLIKVNNFIIENKDRNYMIELLIREVPELSDLITRATTI